MTDTPATGAQRSVEAMATFDRNEFEQFVGAVSTVANEGVIEVAGNGLEAELTGVANVMCLSARAPYGVYGSDEFEQFETGYGDVQRVGVNFKELSEAVDALTGTEGYLLHIYEDELVLQSLHQRESVSRVAPGDVMTDHYNSPDDHVEYTVEFEPAAHRFKGVVGAIAAAVDERGDRDVQLTADEGDLCVRGSHNSSIDEWEYDWSVPADIADFGSVDLAPDYLLDIVDGVRASGEVTVSLGDDAPLRIRMGDWATFHLAARYVERGGPDV